MNRQSPIVVFGFNRPVHLRKTLAALSENFGAEESDLFIFIDGPRDTKDAALIQACVEVSNEFVDRFKSFKLLQGLFNQGLAKSIISGISSVLEKYPTVIVVEDDLVTSPYFLDFINRGLDRFAEDVEVASIHGFVTPFLRPLNGRSF